MEHCLSNGGLILAGDVSKCKGWNWFNGNYGGFQSRSSVGWFEI